jgi:hypothetical protein
VWWEAGNVVGVCVLISLPKSRLEWGDWILLRMSAGYLESRFAPKLWKDDATPLDLAELSR